MTPLPLQTLGCVPPQYYPRFGAPDNIAFDREKWTTYFNTCMATDSSNFSSKIIFIVPAHSRYKIII